MDHSRALFRCNLPEIDTTITKAGDIPVLGHQFIGRRKVIRELYRDFEKKKTPHLFFTGTGGVGKTALAGYFTFYLATEHPGLHTCGYKAPFSFQTIFDDLLKILENMDDFAFLDYISKEPAIEKRVSSMLHRITTKEPLIIILDNIFIATY